MVKNIPTSGNSPLELCKAREKLLEGSCQGSPNKKTSAEIVYNYESDVKFNNKVKTRQTGNALLAGRQGAHLESQQRLVDMSSR